MANPQSSRQIQSPGLAAGTNLIWVVLARPEMRAPMRLIAGRMCKKRRGAEAPRLFEAVSWLRHCLAYGPAIYRGTHKSTNGATMWRP
jgi:hypothetical protein